MTPITTFSDGSTLAFGPGKFDNFCIYFTRPDGTVWFPLDSEYFETLYTLGQEFNPDMLYRDFCLVYDKTHSDIEPKVLQYIVDLGAYSYGASALLFTHTLSVIYAAMVAEENKKDTKLGKRIKRLGVYQVLHGELSPKEAANYSRGMHWPLISVQCKIRGF